MKTKLIHIHTALRRAFALPLAAALALVGSVHAQSVVATGGTITENGGYRIHTFTDGGTLSVTTGGKVEYLILAGGGGSGGVNGNNAGGAGGAGGLRHNVGGTLLTVSAQSYPVVVGAGGVGGPTTGDRGSNGFNSSVFGLTALGGGGGGGDLNATQKDGASGGSGGGGGDSGAGGSGTAGQGNAGANNYGKGGGAGQSGASDTTPGQGLQIDITGTPTYYAGGGSNPFTSSRPLGGGGFGDSTQNGNQATDGEANTGGGGGARWTSVATAGKSGGSGTDYAAGGIYTANAAETMYAQWTDLPVTAGTRRLFLDDHHIQSMTGLSRVYHQPAKDPAPVIVPDKPWETNGWVRPVGWYPYGSHTQVWSPPVWNPELSKWQLWYQGGMEGLPLYAESTDGVNWVKPNLGLVTWGGNTNNNITLLPTAPYTQPNAPHYRIVAIRDTFETNPNRRYKGLVIVASGLDTPGGLIRLISPDGKTWTREGTDVIPAGDEYRLGQDPVTGQFWAIIKLGTWQVPDYNYPADFHPPAYRVAWLRTSSDFVNWTPLQLVGYGSTSDQTQAAAQIAAYKANPAIRKLLYDQPTTLLVNRPAGQSGAYTADVYHMPVFRYQDMFLGLPTRQLQTGWLWPVDKPAPANNDGWQFPYLVSSRDLAAWNKHTGNPFCDVSPLSDTQKSDHGMIQMMPPITVGNQLVFYYTGFRFTHHMWWKMDPTWDKDGIPGLDYNYTAAGLTPEECAKEPSGAIHLARLRLDGFASLRAGGTAGEVVTTALPVNGKSLYVNTAAQAGTLKAELLDAATGTAIPRYTLADSVALQTDAVRAKLQWQGVTDLTALVGRSVKIRFSVQNADLYSFSFEEPVTTDLPVWWKFDETSGTSAADSGLSGNTGTLMNMAGNEWTAGKIGNALSLDGANDYVTRSPLTESIDGACTISLWMKRDGIPTGAERLIDVATASAGGLQLYCQNGTGYATINNSGGLTVDLYSDVNVADGTWHHIAATRSGAEPSIFKIYVDGVLKATDSSVGNTVPSLTRLFVGAMNGPANHFNGQLDEVRVYSRALSDAEIQDLAGVTGPGPVTYTVSYNANGATGGTAPASHTKTQDVALTLATNSGNLAKTDFTFAGWNTAADGSGTSYAAGATYDVNAAVTLFAKWTAITATGPEWNLNNNGNWNINANWLPNTAFPNAIGAAADFSKLNITADCTVTLGQNITVGTIILGDTDGTHKYTIGVSANTLTMQGAAGSSAFITQTSTSAENTFNQLISLNDDLIITNNALNTNLNLNRSIGVATPNRTVTIKGVAPAGDYNSNLIRLNAANTFTKLIVETGGIADVGLNASAGPPAITPDQALGAEPDSFTTDALTLDGGSLRRAGSGTLTIHANRGITLTANGGSLNAASSTRNIIVDSVITGAGSLTIHGGDGIYGTGTGGTVTLNKANTYLGSTIVATGGTLKLAAAASINSSTTIDVKSGASFDVSAKSGFTVGANQTLKGNGTIKGATTVSGILAPGASPGILTFENALTLAGTTVMDIDGIAGAGLTGGHDVTNLTGSGADGTLTCGGTMTLDIGTTFGEGAYSWDLFNFTSETGAFTGITLFGQYAGSLTHSGDGSWGLVNGNNTWSFSESTGVLSLTVSSAPANDFAAWAASQSPPVTGGPNGDDDNDGVENLIEYALADGLERGTLTGSTLSFTKRGAPWNGDITYSIETSDDLGISDPWQAVTPDVDDASTISYTLPNPGDNFARLVVTGP